MSGTVETAGLFSEAAYGVDGPQGLCGVTGGGEAHEIAWKQALQDAKASLPVATAELGSLAASASSDSAHTHASKESAAAHSKAANPMSWDRLSMTVASMVAWNMSVELAEDVSASPLVTIPSTVSGPETAGAEAVAPDSAFQLEQTATPITAASKPVASKLPIENSQTRGSREQFNFAEPTETSTEPLGLNQNVASSSERDGSISTSTTFREGTPDPAVGDGIHNGATEMWSAESVGSVDSQMGTTPNESIPSIMTGIGNFGVSEIPPSLTAGTAIPKATVAPSSMTAGPGEVASTPDDAAFESVIRVRDTSVERPEIAQGRQRLEAIRTVLAQLDQHATERNTVAQVMRSSEPNARAPMTPVAGSVGVAGSAVTKQAGPTAPSATGTGFVQNASGETVLDSDETPVRPFEGATKGLDAQQTRTSPSNRMPVNGNAKQQNDVGTAPSAQTGMAAEASLVGVENAEIAADQRSAAETFQIDAERIEVGEVPELAVQDVSHLDIDIDDPMGTVRLAMTRDAEEVTVRMETPEEVLQQYREMEEEMAEAIAGQGLDLSHFSADAQNPENESESSDSTSSTNLSAGPNQDDRGSDQSLQQSGTVSRLVNRIV